MLQRERFLGLSLRTRRDRRLVVLGYYGVLTGLTALALATHVRHNLLMFYLPQTFIVGGLMGGISYEGPVKPYSNKATSRDPNAGEILTLGLDPPRPTRESQLLDERETGERDHAHYLAYRMVILLTVAAMFYIWVGADFFPAWLVAHALPLLWLSLVTLLSLPQSVILWTEPEPMAEGDMRLVGAPRAYPVPKA